MPRFLTVRQSAALGVAAIATEAVLSVASPVDPAGQRLIGRLTPSGLPSAAHVLAVLVGLALLVLTPGLWRGTRTAVSLASAGLIMLAILNLVKGLEYEEAIPEACLALLLIWGRHEFPLGCRNRPRVAVVFGALAAWALAYCALLVAPLVSGRPRRPLAADLHSAIVHVLHSPAAHPHISADWTSLIDILIACAVAISVMAIRSLLRPAAGDNRHVEHEYRAARAIVERYGEDSISPFILRPDKAFLFAAGGVLGYRVIGETAVVSGDPVGPDGAAPILLESLRRIARGRGWQVALWGASARELDAYRRLGLHAVCAGEEAVVDPRRFTLEGRQVRKLRQSCHRVERRGWQIATCEGRDIGAELEAEIDALEVAWRAGKGRVLGYAMAMGDFDTEVGPSDLYLFARSPEGELGAVMHFISHCGKLSLDTMRRVGETPNGLNEALVCRALQVAGERGVAEVSLNYAGLAHLVRREPRGNALTTWLARLVIALLGDRFQMDRLVRFNEKFDPEWRPRYLVYESRAGLPRAVMRVLQAEGYVQQHRRPRLPRRVQPIPRTVAQPQQAKGAG
jgi:lysyl-tRNA synthetase class 2